MARKKSHLWLNAPKRGAKPRCKVVHVYRSSPKPPTPRFHLYSSPRISRKPLKGLTPKRSRLITPQKCSPAFENLNDASSTESTFDRPERASRRRKLRFREVSCPLAPARGGLAS